MPIRRSLLPVTPFHLGPGLLLKALAPRHFSFTGYVAAQVVIDIESGYNILTNRWPFHRLMHTFVVGSAAGAVAGVAAGMIGAKVLASATGLPRSAVEGEVSRSTTLVGGLVGGALHVLLDGIQHEDMHPFWPFTDATPLLGRLSIFQLEMVCVAAGLCGLLLLVARLARGWGDAESAG